MQKLEEEFLASGGKWKEFLIEDLFEKLDLKFKKKKFNKAEDISQKRTKEFDLPFKNFFSQALFLSFLEDYYEERSLNLDTRLSKIFACPDISSEAAADSCAVAELFCTTEEI